MSEFVVVIPVRFASERLPGKPLRMIAGRTMLEHVYERGRESKAAEVLIATDNDKIVDVARSFGARAYLTDEGHRSGTERIAEICERRRWPDDQVVVNLQGDEPLMPAALIDQCAALLDDDTVDMATLASPLASRSDLENPNVVKVISDNAGNAIYFSRAPIPYSRNETTRELAMNCAMHHHGIYGYRSATLRRIVAAAPADLEICERLEQLRPLSIGIGIRVGIANQKPPPGVDTAEDLAEVERLLLSAR